MRQSERLRAALRGESTPTLPVWLMRQAGRTDPAYNALKEEAGLPLEALFRHPELAAEISLLPRRLDVDGIIFFQDILTPLSPMGAHFVFAPGPVLEEPVEGVEDLDALMPYDIAGNLGFVGETLDLVQAELNGALPVLGFAGAPLTLAVFVLEGKSFGSSADRALGFLREEPEAAHHFLEKLADMTIAYLRYQAGHGVAAVQLFESAAFLLDRETYATFALPYQQRVFNALRGVVPTINFAREWDDLDTLAAAGADVISLPSSIGIAEARARLGEVQVLQGNLDNGLLAKGPWDAIEAAARAVAEAGEHRGHIFNLSHGLLRETPYEHIQRLVEVVHDA